MWSVEPVSSEAQVLAVGQLAHEIWNEHFPGIISQAQIDYMLDRMYSPDAIEREIQGGVRYDLLTHREGHVGYASYGAEGAETKLHKLYIRRRCRRGGGGHALLTRVVDYARQHGHDTIALRVNRHNELAIAAYKKLGFALRAEAVLNIGAGFAMDDYILARTLPSA